MALPEGVTAKLSRAEEHLDSLRSEVGDLLAQYQARMIQKDGRAAGRKELYVLDPPEIPSRWSTIVGDFAHNAHSALDLLISGLLGLDPDSESPAFPICDTPTAWRTSRDRKAIAKVLGSGSQMTAIEGLQPFNSFEQPAFLSMLRELNNVDKHRRISLFLTYINLGFEIRGLQVGDKVSIESTSVEPTDTRKPLVRLSGISGGVQVVAAPGLVVRFREGPADLKDRQLIRTLEPILARVKVAVQDLERFF